MHSIKKKQKSLRTSMIKMLGIGWFLPFLILTLGMLYFVSSMISRQIEKTIIISMDKAIEICEMRIEENVMASKNASYIQTIRESYRQYCKDGEGTKFSKKVTEFLNQHYKYDEEFLCTMLFLLEEPEKIYYTYNTYRDNNNSESAYDRVLYFKENMQEEVMKEGERLDTGIRLMEKEGRLYLVRNLVNTSFCPYAMLVIELDAREMLGSLESVWGAEDYEFYVDGEPLFDKEMQETVKGTKTIGESIYVSNDQNSYVYKVIKWEQQALTFQVMLNKESIIDELTIVKYVCGIAVLFAIPLIMLIFHFFSTKVTKPVSNLVEVAKEIALGNYGCQVEKDGSSEEFAYLNRAFNTMSAELKYQFETIYKEELALKDANIKALQSQINPHFLNNTLEIINWEARMNGNENVSTMIEALATMLNATMNRKQRRFVPLSEEMSYVDAYLYIISRRFGERFQVYREIDESLLKVQVPILIIQPIVENAVEHGVEENKKGTVTIRIFEREEKMYIEVINDGRLSPENKEKINRLLNSEESGDEKHHVSLGIRNVNKRLKIIYGEECGLTIKNDEENRTVSTIIVKLLYEGNNSQ